MNDTTFIPNSAAALEVIKINMKASITVLLFSSLFGLNVSVYRYHYLVNETLTFQEAQQRCTQNFDYLSTVRSKDLSYNSLIKDFFWIGVQRDSADNNKWIWSEGGEATITFWDQNEPNDDSQKCGAVKKDTFKLHDYHCFSRLRFYCMKVYELIVVHQKSTWGEALDYCRQNYIDLAIITQKTSWKKQRLIAQ